MTKIKFCGLTRPCDIAAANEIRADYAGFVFWPKSPRFVTPEKAYELKGMLLKGIKAVGVFIDEKPETVANLLESGVIDIAQLHGSEDESYIKRLIELSGKLVIKAFRVEKGSIAAIERSPADYVLLDSGAGGGTIFDWNLIKNINRPYFLAGGLSPDNVREALHLLNPYAVDVSSGIETAGLKDKKKMAAFAAAVRMEERK